MKRSEAVQALADEEYLENFTPGVITGEVTTRLRLLQHDAEACTDCGRWKERRQVLFGSGNPYAKLMVLGDTPSSDDDVAGEIFTGETRVTLDKMLRGLGLIDGDYYLCNVLKCGPRLEMTAGELQECSGFISKQVDAIRPRVVLALGYHAFLTVCGVKDLSTTVEWGQVVERWIPPGNNEPSHTAYFVACPHPSTVLPGRGDETLRRGVGRALGVVKRLLGGST